MHQEDQPSVDGPVHLVASYAPRPTRIDGLSGVTSITAGAAHTCALLGDGSVRCWGTAVMGPGLDPKDGVPRPVEGVGPVVEIAAGGETTCARRSNGEVVCWGGDLQGQAARPRDPKTGARAPVVVPGVTATQIAMDAGVGYALMADGRVMTWGVRPDGTAGPPIAVAGIANARRVVAGWGGAACAFGGDGDGDARCWGSFLLDEHTRPGSTPERAPWLKGMDVAFGGGNHCRWARPEGELSCWGYNQRGGAGIGTTKAAWKPADVKIRVVHAALGNDFGCAITVKDTIACWGVNDLGQLGIGQRSTERLAPVEQ